MPRPSFRFNCKGLSLTHPVDRMPDGYFPFLQNIRVTQQGKIETRQGIMPLAPGSITAGNDQPPIHSIKRMNSDVDSTFIRICGKGRKLYQDDDVTALDEGYSGSPLSLIPFRPNRSPDPYLYVGDANRLSKISMKGNRFGVGIRPPIDPPVVKLDTPNYELIADFEIPDWTLSGTAAGLTGPVRFNTSIDRILYDEADAGWCSIIPVDATDMRVGAKIGVNGVEATKITEVHQAITLTKLAAILYDTGISGWCSLVLYDVCPNLEPNGVIDIDGEYIRISDVLSGQDGLSSVRCFTALSHAVGDPVAGHTSFRCYVGGSYLTGQSLNSNYFSYSVVTGEGTIAGVGDRKLDVVTPTGEGGRPLTPDDYLHISIKLDNPASLTELRVMIDIGDSTFTQNYYYKSIFPEEISGNGNWTELLFKVSELVRVGTDETRSFATVKALGVWAKVTAATTTLQVNLAGWWIGGTFGLDVIQSQSPLQYAYRYRDSRTGAKSNLSPAIRTGLRPQREQAVIGVVESTDPQVDYIDLFRFGGGLDNFVLVGSHPNVTGQITDSLPTLAVQANEVGVFDDYQPFPISDLPRSGTCDVCGTIVQWKSGDRFNLNWVPGTLITVNGTVCTLYGSPVSEEVLRTVESVGVGKDIAFLLPEPTIAAQPLPAMWSAGGQGTGTFMFGVGDPFNPGFLRWCKGNDPDAASDSGNLEITSPSEPLMNGCEYDGRNFTFSSERLFALFLNNGTVQFTAQVVESGAGLFARHALAVTPYGIAWLAKDGVYLYSGGIPKSLTIDDLYPLFPHGSTTPKPVNGYQPPDFSKPDLLRLAYADNSLFFTYSDLTGAQHCLRFDFKQLGWFPYIYTPGAATVYMEEGKGVNSVLIGGMDGHLYQWGDEATDGGMPIPCRVHTPSLDLGDSRLLKYFMDALVDYSGTVTSIVSFDNNQTFRVPLTITAIQRSQSIIPIAIKDEDKLTLYRNIALDLSWTGMAEVWEFQPNAVAQPMLVTGLATQYTDHGIPGYSHLKEAWISVISTADVTFEIWTDGVRATYTVPASAGDYKRVRVPLAPTKGKQFLYRLLSPDSFIPFDVTVLVKPWGADIAFMPFHPFAQLES